MILDLPWNVELTHLDKNPKNFNKVAMITIIGETRVFKTDISVLVSKLIPESELPNM